MLDAKEMLSALAERCGTSAKVQTVFGEPIQAHGKTIITVARVSYGFGAGGGGAKKAEGQIDAGGSGGGGGVNVNPIGVLEVTEAGTKFIRFFDLKMAARLIVFGVAIGLTLRRALRWRR